MLKRFGWGTAKLLAELAWSTSVTEIRYYFATLPMRAFLASRELPQSLRALLFHLFLHLAAQVFRWRHGDVRPFRHRAQFRPQAPN